MADWVYPMTRTVEGRVFKAVHAEASDWVYLPQDVDLPAGTLVTVSWEVLVCPATLRYDRGVMGEPLTRHCTAEGPHVEHTFSAFFGGSDTYTFGWPTDQQVQRGAEAMFLRSRRGYRHPWSETPGPIRRDYLNDARAALTAALGEP